MRLGGGGVTKGGRSPTGVTPPPRRNFSASDDRGWPGSVGDFLRMENHLCAGSPCNRSSDEAFYEVPTKTTPLRSPPPRRRPAGRQPTASRRMRVFHHRASRHATDVAPILLSISLTSRLFRSSRPLLASVRSPFTTRCCGVIRNCRQVFAARLSGVSDHGGLFTVRSRR